MSTDSTQATGHRAVCSALLDFQRMPGRYPVALREPRSVFDHLHEVLALAAGRRVEGLSGDTELEVQVRQAARFFVRSVMLRPGADHYTLLGVTPGFEAEVLRDHYRLMIRLTHPDFLATGESWPPDAAARINIANDVLSSADKRDAYIATLVTTRHTDSAGALVRSLTSPPPLPRRVPTSAPEARSQGRHGMGRRWPSGMGPTASAGMALVAVVGWLWMWPSPEDPSLAVVRPTPAGLTAAVTDTAPTAPTPPMAPAPERPPAAAKPAALVVAARPALLAGLSTRLSIPPAQPVVAAMPVQARAPAGSRPALAVVAVSNVGGSLDTDETNRGIRLTIDSSLQQPPAEIRPAVAVAPPPATERTVSAVPPSGPGPVIHMGQVQPVLSNVTASLQSGRAEEVLQWVDRASRNDELAAQFAQKYQQALAGARVTGLGQVRFTPRFAAEQLVVDGVVQLRLQDEKQQTTVKDFHLRAYFRSQGNNSPVLARLVAE